MYEKTQSVDTANPIDVTIKRALAPFETEKLQNGSYILTDLKNRKEMFIEIPDGVQIIADNAFAGSDVIDVKLPEGLIKIGNSAFANCTDLETINFPATLRIIGDLAFAGCAALDVEVPEKVRIGKDAFQDTLPDVRAKAKADEERRKQEERKRKEARSAELLCCEAAQYFYKEDYEKAVELYRKAAEQGNIDAQYILGDCYENGYGVEENENEAVKWYRKAAEQGHGEAKERLHIHSLGNKC